MENISVSRRFYILLDQDVIKLNDPADKELVASRDLNNFVHLQASAVQ